MAESDQEQKTQEPTQKRLDEARDRGEVANAPEMRHAMMFAGMMIVAGGLGSVMLGSLTTMFLRLWGSAEDYRLEPLGAQDLAAGILRQAAMSLAPVGGLLFACAALTLIVQGRPTLSWSRVTPKWSKVSPLSGFNRLLGKRALVEFAKTLAKFAIVITVAMIILWPKAIALDQLVGAGTTTIGRTAGQLVFDLIKTIGVMVLALGVIDFVYQHRAFLKRMRMTLQEVKDEMKSNEGDPQIKARIRAIRIQRSRRRMMAAVPQASVIITNPTHYAVALKYEHGNMAAPVVVAKGVDAVALKIREVAGLNKVPIVENPPLARALYAAVELDRTIPVEHYAAVAEIIGFVMRIARRAA
ncbi:flagellar biosynthesis protein FlhB [Sphingomonas qilianensis]|uniref:Flagellar biosynthetic protein FlhB n=1 Tax=Sphingomonas qilianensis TaxID=1736690 RepID=A0ABU9XQM3_9SPHN